MLCSRNNRIVERSLLQQGLLAWSNKKQPIAGFHNISLFPNLWAGHRAHGVQGSVVKRWLLYASAVLPVVLLFQHTIYPICYLIVFRVRVAEV